MRVIIIPRSTKRMQEAVEDSDEYEILRQPLEQITTDCCARPVLPYQMQSELPQFMCTTSSSVPDDVHITVKADVVPKRVRDLEICEFRSDVMRSAVDFSHLIVYCDRPAILY